MLKPDFPWNIKGLKCPQKLEWLVVLGMLKAAYPRNIKGLLSQKIEMLVPEIEMLDCPQKLKYLVVPRN